MRFTTLNKHRKLTLFIIEAVVACAFASIYTMLSPSGRVFADCVVYENQYPGNNIPPSAGCVESSNYINSLGNQCLSDNTLVGWDFFVTNAQVINNQDTQVKIGNIDCVNNGAKVTNDNTYYSTDYITQYEGTPYTSAQQNASAGAIILPGPTTSCLSQPSPYYLTPPQNCFPVYGPLPQYSFGPNTWTYSETTETLKGSDFTNTGWYLISFTGYGSLCGYNLPSDSPFCTSTGMGTADLWIYVTVVTPECGVVTFTPGNNTSNVDQLQATISLSTIDGYPTNDIPPGSNNYIQFNVTSEVGNAQPSIGGYVYSVSGLSTSNPQISVTANMNDPPPGTYDISYSYSLYDGLLTGNSTASCDQLETIPIVNCSPPPTIGNNEFKASFYITNYFPDYTKIEFPNHPPPISGNNDYVYFQAPFVIPNTYQASPFKNSTEVITARTNAVSSGKYTVYYRFDNYSGTCLATIDKQPYFKVYGGDVVVGSGMAGAQQCKVNKYASIYAWNPGSGYYGSSTNSAAFVTDLIYGFATDNGQSLTSPSSSGSSSSSGIGPGPPQALTFANSESNSSTPRYYPYGGDFGSVAPCIGYGNGSSAVSYYTEFSAYPNDPHIISSARSSLSTNINGYPTTNPTLSHCPQNVYLFNNEDVTISSSIKIPPNCRWSDAAGMPYFYVIVHGGNIKIDPNVKVLDGVFIAEPSSAGQGSIYTCYVKGVNGNAFDRGGTGSCDNQLLVNGAFIANQIYLQRTYGTVSQATFFNSCSTADKAAEIFCYSPMDWLANPLPVNSSFESITNLPPVL